MMSEFDRWQRQLIIIWLAQFLSIVSFCVGLPFAAYHIQQLGVQGDDVLWWATVFAIAAPICFAAAAPFWGIMADKYGRKKMLLRANICAALVLFGMGWSPNVYWLIVFRVGQGLFTGVMPAAQTLLAVSTPPERQGMALGSLAASVAAGVGLGSALGGRVAEAYGYDIAFYVGGVLSLLASLLVLVGCREKHDKTARIERTSPQPRVLSKSIFLLFMMISAISILSNIDNATFPLLIQDLNNAIEGAAKIVGDINALAGIAFAVGGILWGWLGDRFGPYRVLISTALLTALASIPLCYVRSFGIEPLYYLVLLCAFFMAGMDPIIQGLVSKQTAPEDRGRVFGYFAAFRSVGWLGGPVLGSYIALQSDLSQVYWLRLLMVALIVPLALWSLSLYSKRSAS